MNIKKIALSTIAGATIVAVSGAGAVWATDDTQTASLSEFISERFGLDQNEVEDVITEYRGEYGYGPRGGRMGEDWEMGGRMGDRLEVRLQEALDAGDITAEQMDAMLAKHEEMEAEREANREQWESLSPEDRQALGDEHRQEMETWMEEQGIHLENFGPEGQRGQGLGDGSGMGMRGMHRLDN